MQNKKLIILIALSVVAVISLFYGMFAPTKDRRESLKRPQDYQQEATPTNVKGIIQTTRQARKTSFASWGRSPFTLSPIAVDVSIGPKLEGIIWDKDNPMAVINGSIVGIGDKIGTNIVVDIKSDRVILNDGSKDFELKLNL